MEQKAINSLFNRFSGMSILVIGDVMVDSYIWGKVDRISPEAPVPVVSITKRENRPGGAANVALNILSMGAVPLVCSVIGKDEKGELFMQLMKNYGMCMDGIIMDGIRKTTSKTRVISGGQQLLRVDEELTSPLVKQQEEELMERIGKMIDSKKPAAIILQDYDKGVITETLISGTIKKAKSMGI
ncbi:MAG: PfkB family carbohydrate kinase, partial [Bacteroidota bacterium]